MALMNVPAWPIPIRRVYRLQNVITTKHVDNVAKMILATGLIVDYAYVTTHPVTRSILAMLSRWFFVMMSRRPKTARAGIISWSTIAKPE